MEATLKNLRIIQMALIGSLGLLVYLIERIHTAPAILKPAVLMVFIALAIYLTFSIISFRTRFLSRVEEKLRLQPTDAAALKKWRVLNIAIFGMCESLGLYGIVLRDGRFCLSSCWILCRRYHSHVALNSPPAITFLLRKVHYENQSYRLVKYST